MLCYMNEKIPALSMNENKQYTVTLDGMQCNPIVKVCSVCQIFKGCIFVRLDLIFANGMQWYFPLLASLQLLLNNSALILVLDAGFGSDPLNIVKMSHLPRCADTSTFRGFKTVNTDTAWLIINISTSLCVRVGLHKCTP